MDFGRPQSQSSIIQQDVNLQAATASVMTGSSDLHLAKPQPCNPDLLKVFWQLCRQLLSLVMVLHIQRYGMYRYLSAGRRKKLAISICVLSDCSMYISCCCEMQCV